MEDTTHPSAPAKAGAPRRSVLHNPYLWAFLLGIVVLTLMRPFLRHVPDPPPVIGQVPSFALTDTAGRPFGSEDLAGSVYVANFIFTRCTSICPLLTRAMKRLEEGYERAEIEGIRLVSITVDPEYDTPEILREYGATHGIDPSRWTLLTGSRDAVEALVIGGFKTALGEAQESAPGLVDIAHSGKLVLVDGSGAIRGYYDTDDMGLDEVYHRSQHVLDEEQSR